MRKMVEISQFLLEHVLAAIDGMSLR